MIKFYNFTSIKLNALFIFAGATDTIASRGKSPKRKYRRVNTESLTRNRKYSTVVQKDRYAILSNGSRLLTVIRESYRCDTLQLHYNNFVTKRFNLNSSPRWLKTRFSAFSLSTGLLRHRPSEEHHPVAQVSHLPRKSILTTHPTTLDNGWHWLDILKTTDSIFS
jgi:hypothetical protein